MQSFEKLIIVLLVPGLMGALLSLVALFIRDYDIEKSFGQRMQFAAMAALVISLVAAEQWAEVNNGLRSGQANIKKLKEIHSYSSLKLAQYRPFWGQKVRYRARRNSREKFQPENAPDKPVILAGK